MAPAVQSIGVYAHDFALDGQGVLAQTYNDMQGHFKVAQFANINGSIYWENIDAALDDYANIVAATQGIVVANSSPLQRRIAGRWLSLQTVAPRLKKQTCLRPQPSQIAPSCI